MCTEQCLGSGPNPSNCTPLHKCMTIYTSGSSGKVYTLNLEWNLFYDPNLQYIIAIFIAFCLTAEMDSTDSPSNTVEKEAMEKEEEAIISDSEEKIVYRYKVGKTTAYFYVYICMVRLFTTQKQGICRSYLGLKVK